MSVQKDAPLMFWIAKEGWIYTGDKIPGARAATDDEIAAHMASVAEVADIDPVEPD